MSKALVVLSGGQDSTTCLFFAIHIFGKDNVTALTFDYNQRHRREVACAMDIVRLAGIERHEILEVPHVLGGRSPLTDSAEQLEQYENHDQMERVIGSRVEKTFVPMRNALFLTIAANRAVCADIYQIVTGVCQADNANYPDCRLTFIRAQEKAINEALGLYDTFGGPNVTLHTPLMDMSKAESIHFAIGIPGAYSALAYSHTAYDGQYPPTGKDHATILRAHGFEEAGWPDPLILRAWREGLIDPPEGKNYTVGRIEMAFERLGKELRDATWLRNWWD